MPRREFPPKVKAEAALRAAGRCEGCTARLAPGGYHYDHVLPDALGGEPVLGNCEVLCTNCHGAKTAAQDVPAIARAKRLHRKNVGAKAPSRNPVPGGRLSRLKRKVGGGVVLRETGEAL